MVRYSLIVDYLDRGNNFSQVARLCCCSRMTVWRVVQRLDSIKIETIDLKHISEGELRSLLFPERVKKGEKYLIPDFKWEEFQMRKHQSSLRLCWRRYCKRAAKQGLKAYSWASFGLLYSQYKKPCADDDDPHDAVRNKLKHYNLLLSYADGEYIDREMLLDLYIKLGASNVLDFIEFGSGYEWENNIDLFDEI